MARVLHSTDGVSTALDAGWELTATEPGRAVDPEALAATTTDWTRARVPGTAASALREAGAWSFEAPRDFDAEDHWYRCRFAHQRSGARAILALRGLATVAEVWLNGERILRSDNMFHEHAVDVTERLRDDNELLLRFVALSSVLAQRRPRPRWKTRLVTQQQLRWIRTTLLGRIPGWTPPVTAVGPWRPISIEEHTLAIVDDAAVSPRLDGRDGVVTVRIAVRPLRGRVEGATLEVGDAQSELVVRDEGGVTVLEGEARLHEVAPWWPHTHGEQPRYRVRVDLHVDGAELGLDFGSTGFRTVAVDTTDGGFGVSVNGERVFCRGVCSTVNDIASLSGSPAEHRAALGALREAGVNMIRVGGTMIYEDDAFYELCDELGILVWQDFMFANMDYPFADEAFVTSVKREASQLLSRLQLRASLAVLCGNSEGEQQAAMLGLARELWSSPLFRELLPSVAAAWRPDVHYWPSSSSGGALPFHPGAGTTSYYGVGAYLRPPDDARRSDLRFGAECLAFANVPRDETIEAVLGNGQSPFHHPAWKQRAPRDNGPGWDFEDVRDHYLASFFGVDPMRLRYADMNRYLALSRVVTGEAMEGAFAEWRRRGSRCGGALVWFHRDLWPGAGWGVVDAAGAPKAAYYYLKRALQPVALVITDEGLNGLALHAVNEAADPLDVTVALTLYRHGESAVGQGAVDVTLGARSVVELSGDALIGRFTDLTYAYRFGPPGHDLAVATMTCRRTGARLGEAFHFPLGRAAFPPTDLGLEAHGELRDGGEVALTVRTARFAQAVAVDARGYLASDDFFHLAPGGARTLTLRPLTAGARLYASVRALNGRGPIRVTIAEETSGRR